jgi:uncharacterized protein GlcG (DUF336 family)
MPLTLATANAVIEHAFAYARTHELKPLTAAVLDSGGHLIALQREDGSSTLRPQIAVGKAAGALGLGISSRKIAEMAADRPTFVTALAALATTGMIPAAGGVIVIDDKGCPIGAVGITGDTSDNDELAALAGIAGAGLKSQ